MNYNKYNFAFTLILVLIISINCLKVNNTGTSPNQPGTGTFVNPLMPSGPDPWVLRKGNDYYYMCTLGNRLAIWKTKGIGQLKNAGSVTVWAPPKGQAYSTDIWAPELHFINNKWYIYFAADSAGNNSTHRIYVLENQTSNPMDATAWVFKGKVAEPSGKWAIDATVFTYKGNNYMAWSGWQGDNDGEQDIYIAQMLSPYTLGNRVLISRPSYSWETITKNVMINEGPEALMNAQGNLFLFYSANGCWVDDYCLGMLSLKQGGNPLNPSDWVKAPNPAFSKNVNGGVFGPGHNGFFKSPDGKEDWIIYHANISTGQGCGPQRCPRIQQFSWNNDGTPNLGTPLGINTPVNKPSGE